MNAKRYLPARSLRGWRSDGGDLVRLELEGAVAALSIAEDGAVRLRAARGSELPPDADAAIGRDPWRPVALEAADAGAGRLVVRAARAPAEIEIESDPFALRVWDRRRAPVAALLGIGFASDGASRLELEATRSERFFGFGEKSGPLDKRGALLRMRNRDPESQSHRDPLYVSIPFFLGFDAARARGVLLDSFAPTRFDVARSRPDRVIYETDAGGVDATFFPGPAPADVVRRFTARVGRSPLPPLWALGHHQSRWSYASEKEVRGLARRIRAHHLPTDVIHLDIDYMDGFRVFSWHPDRFPDPQGLLRDLAQQGFRVVTIVDPGVKTDPAYPVFRDGSERDVFCRSEDGSVYTLMVWPRRSALPDFNRDDVREWWSGRHAPLLDAGVAGIWNDMNEPAGWAAELRVGRLILPYRRQDLSRVRQRDPLDPEHSVAHEHVRNLYGHQECRATRHALETARPQQRPFVLTRSGYAGIQRFAAVWTGDNWSTWSHLRQSLPMLLNLSLSGVALCGSDIGGFAFSCTPELYARWIQLGAFYPFARTHSMWLKRRQEPWSFGRRVEAIAREALELRMRLLPYLYGLFRDAEESGAPVWRPLFFEFPGDPDAAGVEDQVMVGPSLLLAPVLERGVREREVQLPPGSWISWHDGARFIGPRRVRIAAPLERIPLFARGGSLIPTQSRVAHVGEAPREPCVLQVFPGGDATAALVEDDGISHAYRDGVLARTALRLTDPAGGRLRIELGRREGSFALAERRVRIVVHACPRPQAVFLDGVRVAEGAGAPGYTLSDGRVHVRLVDAGEGHALEIEPAP